MNKNSSINEGSGCGLILAFFGMLVFCFVGSFILGWSIVGPEVYDFTVNPTGQRRFANEDDALLAVTFSHLLCWLGLVGINKHLSQSILGTIVWSLCALPFFWKSWFLLVTIIILLPE